MPIYSITTEERVFPVASPDQKIMLMNQGPVPIQYEAGGEWSDLSPWLQPARNATLPAGIEFKARAPTAQGITYGRLMVARLPIGM